MSVLSRTTPPAPPPPEPARPRSGWFRAFWRWHFYASFLVIPVLLVLAVTGLVYLFRFQLEPLLHADLMKVSQPAGSEVTQPYADQLRAVEKAHPDATVVSMAEPRSAGRSTAFSVTEPDGSAREVYVDPWTAEVLGELDPDNTVSGIAIRLHADLMSGVVGDRVMELGTCWALVMALTGYYLFAKGWRARRRNRQRGRPGARLRARHGVLGAFVGVGLVFMIGSGLPWTGVWGAHVQRLATTSGTSLWSLDHGAESKPSSTLDESLPHSHAQLPWGLQKSAVPDGAEPGDEVAVADLDTAIAVGERAGLRHPMTVALPGDDGGTFSAIGYAFDQPSDERTVHVDRYGGEVRATYGYDDYPLLAKVVSQGIGLHEGRSLGVPNLVASALFCVAVIALGVTGPLMWWRRRPRGPRLGAPRGRLPVRSTPLLAVALVALGLFLPLFGISLVAVLLLDRFVLRRVPALGDFFAVG
ncbi:MAG: hypothetical protein JWR90_2750 [Marmoricola sp.]|nr:hypothetical protein [Marmoricola sp.]